MEAVVLAYIVVAAQCHGWHYFVFPGLAALSHDVLTRPTGKWAAQRLRLVVTPVLGATIGTLITRTLPFGVLAILLIVTSCLLLLTLLKSNIAPAIAAGVLPLFLDIRSWLSPASIALSLVVLFTILVLLQRYCRRKYRQQASDASSDDVLETLPGGHTWLLPFFAFVTVMALCATALDMRLVLFPPLIVMAYEMFAHPTTCPWAGKPLALPAACCLAATAGWAAVGVCGSGGVAAGCGLMSGVLALRLLRLHMPPALAIGLLPLVINSPSIKYPVSVAIGAGALTLGYQFYQRSLSGRGHRHPGFPNRIQSG